MNRLLVMALLAGCTSSVPAVELVDETESVGLPLKASACALMHDFDGDGRAELVTAPVDAGGGSSGLVVARWNGARFDLRRLELGTLDVIACAVSPGGRLAAVARGAQGPGLYFDGNRVADFVVPSALLWLDETRLLVGSLAAGGTVGQLGDDGVGHCTHTASPQPIVLWTEGGAPRELVAAYVNRFDQVTTEGRQFIYVSQDCAPSVLLDEQFAVYTMPWQHTNAAMGAAALSFAGAAALYVADVPWDRLFVAREDLADAAGVVMATRWHSGWSPVVADFDGDGDDDVFVASAMVAEDLGTFRAALERGASTERPVDFLLLQQDGRRFGATRIPHRADRGAIAACEAAAGDVDGDGAPDVLVACNLQRQGELRFLRNRRKP